MVFCSYFVLKLAWLLKKKVDSIVFGGFQLLFAEFRGVLF